MKASTLKRHPSIAPGGRGLVLSRLHPAHSSGRTLFPSRVFAPGEVDRVLKSGHHSRKIGKVSLKGETKGWPIYTLTLEERASCPRSCQQWARCYGNNMQFAERIEGGFALEAKLLAELGALQLKHPRGFLVRLHVLGDFYDWGYLETWHRALDILPALHCWGFTAHDPARGIGKQIALMSEVHGWHRWAIRFSGAPGRDRAARVGADPDPDAILCPAQTGATLACATCALCWTSERSIRFEAH